MCCVIEKLHGLLEFCTERPFLEALNTAARSALQQMITFTGSTDP